MISIPEQFECGGRIWDVVVVPEGTLFDDGGNRACGLADFDKAEVQIEYNDSPRLMLQVFCHELAHAMFNGFGVFDQEEPEIHRQIDALGTQLMTFFITNKGRAKEPKIATTK